MIRRIFILCLMLCFVSLSACGKTEESITLERESEMPVIFNEERKENTTKISGVVQKDNELYFANTLEDFIDCYNNYYYRDNGKIYIKPYSEWYSYVQDFGRYKGDMHYEFTADKKIWTLPTITVYTPKDETTMKELTVDFDDHSYTEKMYKQYEEMCFYTLKVFFPDRNEKELTKLYKKLNKKACANIFQNEQGFHSDNPPSDLYYRDGVGIYPYFAYGESVRMCIIPVTKKVIKAYEKKAVKIHKF